VVLIQNVDVKSNVVFDYSKAPKGDCANGFRKRFDAIGIFNRNRVLFDASYNQKDDIKKQKRKIKKGAKKLAEKDEKKYKIIVLVILYLYS
jgi:hypothetical protein